VGLKHPNRDHSLKTKPLLFFLFHYFRLSFGKADSLYTQIIELQKELNIPIDASSKESTRSKKSWERDINYF
jgi:hypothetical protein